MKKFKSMLVLSLVAAMGLSLLSGCGKKYKALDTGVSGEISVMVWSGSGNYWEDIGKQNLTPQDLTHQNDAAVYAMAKKFNEKYPNVKINLYAKLQGPTDGELSWAQEIENFKANYGKYPDIYASTDLPGDVAKGMVADLSVFKDDPVYKSFNPAIMKMMNYYGFQAGLPQYLLPWGIYVNRELAEQNNIDAPPVDWNLDQYTSFVSSANNRTFWGAMDVPMALINTGTTTIRKQLANYTGDGDHVNLNSEEVTELLKYIPQWSKSAIYPQNDLGNLPEGTMDANGGWSFNFFKNNVILTLDGDPWMMGDAANPNPDHWGRIQSEDWDIYPRPSTPYVGNTVGIVLDPMAIHNYAMDDGNPEWSDDEKAKLQLSYTFATYWAGSVEALEARVNQTFMDGETEKTSVNDSLPLVTGKDFEEHMKVWYTAPIHERFADKDKMPGWQKVLELWEKGELWDISDKSNVYYIQEDGERKVALFEWENYWNPDITGARRTDPNWLDQIKAKLPDWNTAANARFKESENALRDGLKNYYGYTDDKFVTKK